jgi:hypothetical protein
MPLQPPCIISPFISNILLSSLTPLPACPPAVLLADSFEWKLVNYSTTVPGRRSMSKSNVILLKRRWANNTIQHNTVLCSTVQNFNPTTVAHNRWIKLLYSTDCEREFGCVSHWKTLWYSTGVWEECVVVPARDSPYVRTARKTTVLRLQVQHSTVPSRWVQRKTYFECCSVQCRTTASDLVGGRLLWQWRRFDSSLIAFQRRASEKQSVTSMTSVVSCKTWPWKLCTVVLYRTVYCKLNLRGQLEIPTPRRTNTN